MKLTKTTLLKKKPAISGFGSTQDSVYREFQEYGGRENVVLPKHLQILYADYTYEDYTGDAYVLGFDKQWNKFFEVHGSHCSCYGLEGQWEPEYYEDVKQLSTVIVKRIDSRSEWYRSADSSVEFENWLKGEQ